MSTAHSAVEEDLADHAVYKIPQLDDAVEDFPQL
jgi:hypothetical protein